MKHDVIIVGGGPTGSAAAAMLSREWDVAVLEEHDVSGLPIQCTGLVSPVVMKLAGSRQEPLNAFRGAYIHFPDGRRLSVMSPDVKAVVIDRAAFDQELAEKARDAGANFLYKHRYLGRRYDNYNHIHTDRGDMKCRLLVGADGQKSRVADDIGSRPPREWVRGMQVDIALPDGSDLVDIHIGRKVAPGFFAWRMPCGDFTRVGLCVAWEYGPPSSYLHNFLRKLGLEDIKVIARHSGKIPLGGRGRTYSDGALLVGDAAGQVKPVSGGGLQPGLTAVRCLVETANEALRLNKLNASYLKRYEKRWRGVLGRELDNGYRLRQIYTSIGDDEMNRVAEMVDRPDISEILNSGDIDHPSELAPHILRMAPGLLRLSPRLLMAMLMR